MQEAYDYILNAKYPVKMNVIMGKLCEFHQGNEDFSGLLKKAFKKNLKKIKLDFIKRIKEKGQELADKSKDSYLDEFEIPEFDQSLKREISRLCQEIFEGTDFDENRFQNNLEKTFYSSYIQRLLLQKNNYYTELINQFINDISNINSTWFRNHLYNNTHTFVIEELNISQNLRIQINRIERIYPKLQKILNKKINEKLLKDISVYVFDKLQSLALKNIDEDADLIKLSCLILNDYHSRSSRYCNYLNNLAGNCFKITFMVQETKLEWKNINTKRRIDTYIYVYLIASSALLDLRNIPKIYHSSFFIDLETNEMSITREILRKISKKYMIFDSGQYISKLTSIKNPFECFKIIELNVNEFFLSQSIQRNPEPNRILEKFKKLTNNNSSHIVILVSGYLSKNDDHKNEWKNLINFYPNNTFYSYIWESSTYKDMILSVFKISFGINHFNKVYGRAEEEGVVLSNFLMNPEFFKGKSISLVGFSLGTVVINSCLQSLCSERKKIIHDCILLGSAIDIQVAQYNQSQRDHVVTGKFYNVYSTNDLILNDFFYVTNRTSAFGISEVPGMKNKDVSDIVAGHSDYRKNLETIFKRIKNF